MNAAQAQPVGFSPADLDRIAKLVKSGRCALFLGPLASCDQAGRPLRHLLAQEIADQYFQKTGIHLPEPDNLSLSATAFDKLPDTSELDLEEIVQQFYAHHTEPSALLKEVSKLPFRLVFTVAQDMLLQKAFLQTQKRQAEDDFYWFGKTQTDKIDDVPKDYTFIYQLFGRVAEDKESSLVLTVADQLAFIDSIQGPGKETHLPAGLRKAMLDFDAFLFIGFDYENWYLKVLFHILKFPEKAKLFYGLPEGRSAQMGAATADFFKHQYRFAFHGDQPFDLLTRIRERLDSPKTLEGSRPGHEASRFGHEGSRPEPERSLIFLHHPCKEDEATRLNIARQLSNSLRSHFLGETSLHEFEAGDTNALRSRKINEASVIVLLFSPEFVADDDLMALAEAAIARKSDSVIVLAVCMRSTLGVSDILAKRILEFPVDYSRQLGLTEEAITKKAAEWIERFIQILPKP